MQGSKRLRPPRFPRGPLLLTCRRSPRRRNKEKSPLSLDDCQGGDDDDDHNDADAVDLWEGGRAVVQDAERLH